MDVIEGIAFVFGDNVDTDQIYPGRYLDLSDHREIALHAMEGIDPDFVKKVSQLVEIGPVVVAGRNFGCGSSREHAVIALKEIGVRAIVAKSFGRIFYRNALNQGLLLLDVPELKLNEIRGGAKVSIFLREGSLFFDGILSFRFKVPSESFLRLIEEGGVISYIKKYGKLEF